jgi:hypothetical protein
MNDDARSYCLHTALAGLVVLAFAISAVSVGAQPTSDVAIGARVRVMSSSTKEWRTGSLLSLDSAAVVVRQKGPHTPIGQKVELPAPDVFPISEVRAIEVSRGRHGRAIYTIGGSALGLITGALVGGVLGAGAGCGGHCEGEEGYAMITGMALGAPLGVIIGGTFGFSHSPERWESVPIHGRPAVLHR